MVASSAQPPQPQPLTGTSTTNNAASTMPSLAATSPTAVDASKTPSLLSHFPPLPSSPTSTLTAVGPDSTQSTQLSAPLVASTAQVSGQLPAQLSAPLPSTQLPNHLPAKPSTQVSNQSHNQLPQTQMSTLPPTHNTEHERSGALPASVSAVAASGGFTQSFSSVGGGGGGFLSQLGERFSSTASASTLKLAASRSISAQSVQPHGSAAPGSAVVDDHVYSLNADDYDIGKLIGFGSSASVHIALYKPMNRRVAIKMIDLDQFERNQIDELRKELQVMSLCKHPNLLNVKGSFVVESKLYIVTPFLSAGSCQDIMKTAFPDGFEEPAIAVILKQALLGLDYLHRNGLIHRDVKAGNLLMDFDGTVKLADFGVSSSLNEPGDRKGMRKTFVGTPCWIAPEVVQQIGYDCRADIWSFGITSLELAHGRAPFAKYPPMKVLMMTLKNDPPTLDRSSSKRKFTKTFKEMIDSCLQKNPSARPMAEKLLQHAFFKHAKKKTFLADSIARKIPPVDERPHREPKKKEEVQIMEQSWDFSDNDPPSLDPTEIMSRKSSLEPSPFSSEEQLNESPNSPSAQFLPPSSTLNDSSPPNPATTPETMGTVQQQKKGRFVVDVQVNSNSQAPVESGVQSARPAQHSRHPSAGSIGLGIEGQSSPPNFTLPPVLQSIPAPVANTEVKKGRFSVMGDGAAATPTANIPGAQQPEEETDDKKILTPSTDTKKRVKIADANAIFGFMPGAAMTASQSSAIDKDSTKPKRDNSILPESLRRGRFEVTSTPHSNLVSPDSHTGLPSIDEMASFSSPLTTPLQASLTTTSVASTNMSVLSNDFGASNIAGNMNSQSAQIQARVPVSTRPTSGPSSSSRSGLTDQLLFLLNQTDQQRQILIEILQRSRTLGEDGKNAEQRDNASINAQLQALSLENETLRRENDRLKSELDRLKSGDETSV